MWFTRDELFFWRMMFGLYSITICARGGSLGISRRSNPLSDWALVMNDGKFTGEFART